MKNRIVQTCTLLAVTLTLLSACSTHCNCPSCPVQTQTQPQTTIIHEPSNSY